MRLKIAALILCAAAASMTAQQAQQAPSAPPVVASVPSCPELATALTNLARSDVRMRDWPNLARYRDANKTLGAARGGEKRVVFMGDSITDAWPQRASEFFAGRPYVGRGISAQTTPQMLLRFRQDVVDLKAKVVVILAGTNDIASNTGPMTDEEIQGNLTSMAQLAKAHDIKVVFSSVLPVSAYHTAAERRPPDHPPADDSHPRDQRLDEEVREGRRSRLPRLLLGDDRRHRPPADRAERRRPASERAPATRSWGRWRTPRSRKRLK